MYGLPPGCLNVWLPLTHPARPVSALHVESRPGAEDFHALLPEYGEMALFDGRRCIHYTLPNQSGQTRVSIDFRVVPVGGKAADRILPVGRGAVGAAAVGGGQEGAHGMSRGWGGLSVPTGGGGRGRRGRGADRLTPEQKLLANGYFSLACQCSTGDSGRVFRCVAPGRVSRLHGLPHPDKPLVDPIALWEELICASVSTER
eukprot:scaffold49_cov115-Isochrysis_galbana.AAC.5